MDFNFLLKFNTEKNGESMNILAAIIIVWFPLMAVVSLINLFSAFGIMSLLGLAIAAVQLLGAYNAAFFRESGRKLLQLTNLVNLAWTVLNFIVGAIRGGFSFGGLLSCLLNCAITCLIMWYLEQKKEMFDNY